MEISVMSGLPNGTIYPILHRLERTGWLTSYWEDIDTKKAGRPPRRYYRLTAHSIQPARDALAYSRNSLLLKGI